MSEKAFELLKFSAPEIILVLPLLLIFMLLKWNPLENRKMSGVLSHIFLATLIQLIIEVIANLLLCLDHRFYVPSIIINFVYFFLDGLIPFLMVVLKLLPQARISRLKYWLASFYVYIALLIMNLFTGWIYTISPDNEYARGPLVLLSIGFAVFYMAVAVFYILIDMQKYSEKDKVLIYFALLITFVGIVLQIFFFINVQWMSAAISLIILYLFLIREQFQLDKLTGIENRNQFTQRMLRMERKNCVWLIMADMNCIKSINDNYGHAFGDEAIIDVATTFKNLFGSYGNVCRIGGDEFCIICPEKLDEHKIDELMKLAERSVSQWLKFINASALISYGKACYHGPDSNESLSQVLKRADDNMYQMKHEIKRALRKSERV